MNMPLELDIRYSAEELLGFYSKAPIAPCLEGKSNVYNHFV